MTMTRNTRELRRAGRHATGCAHESGAEGHGEAGAVLVLALVLLVAAGMIIISLLGWSGNDLVNTAHLNTDRSTNYSAGGATEVAIWSTRYSYTAQTANPVACPGTNPSINVNGQYFEAWCSTVSQPGTATTRVVTISTCQLPSAAGLLSICASPFLQAVVTFNDYNNLNVDQCSALTQGSCGTGMTLNSWVVK